MYKRQGDEFVLAGTKLHVYFAQAADTLLVLARTGEADDAIDLFLVPRDAPGVSLTQKMSISSDTQYLVEFDDVRGPADARLGDAGTGWTTWHDVMHDGAILASAQAMGGTEYTLEITAEYSKDREQFDKPLAAFQSLSHYMADAKTELDGGKVLTYEAAWARTTGRPANRLAPMAKLFTGKVYRDTTAMAQQIFGGVGFTVEYDVQLYFRRAKQLQLSWWDSRTCEDLVATAVLDAA